MLKELEFSPHDLYVAEADGKRRAVEVFNTIAEYNKSIEKLYICLLEREDYAAECLSRLRVEVLDVTRTGSAGRYRRHETNLLHTDRAYAGCACRFGG